MITAITEQEFRTLFPGREDIWELLNTQPKTEEELLFKYLPSKLWRLNNLYTIIDKRGNKIKFKMNRAQFYVWAHLNIHWRLVILKSRQQGISTLFLVAYSDDAIFLSDLNCGLMAQDRDAAELLLTRVKTLWDNVDDYFKNFLARKLVKDNTQEFKFNNGSSMFIRTSFRSATLHRLHVSELGKIANKFPEKARETKTGTLQALAPPNLGIIESTAEGSNMFKHMWDAAKTIKEQGLGDLLHAEMELFQKLWNPDLIHQYEPKLAGKDFYPVFLSWLYDPDCVEPQEQYINQETADYFKKTERDTGIILTPEQKNFWIAQERELEGDIYQEYPATPEEAFMAAKDGTYWARRYLSTVIHNDQVRDNLYDPNLPVYIACDLGKNDYFVLLFFQVFQENANNYTIRFIHEYWNNGEFISYYAKYIKRIAKERGYNVETLALPHDASVEDLSSEGKTREEIFNDNGITNTEILPKYGLSSGIQLVREELPNVYIDSSLVYIPNCILNYSKEWDDTHKVWKVTPKKSEHNHGADTVRYAIEYTINYLIELPYDYDDDYDNDSMNDRLSGADGVAI